jgi:serine/threonine-protein kinase
LERPFSAYDGDEPYLFVCYAHGDAEAVYPEITWLKDQGFNIYYDEGISPGSVWRDTLANSITGAGLLLFFVSPRSVDSVNCQREVAYAVDHDIPVLAVHLEETELPSGMDLTLSTIQALRRSDLPEQDYRIKLLLGISERMPRGIAATGKGLTQSHQSTSPRPLAVAALIGIVAGLVVGWLVSHPSAEPASASPTVRAEIALTPGHRLAWFGIMSFGLSEDGNRVAFAAAPTDSVNLDNAILFVRDLDSGVITRFPGTDRAQAPFFSPDGRWIGYWVDGSLVKVPSSGGNPALVAMQGVQAPRGAVWMPNDEIVFATSAHTSLQKVDAGGGPITILIEPETGGHRYAMPHRLPTGDLLFTRFSTIDGSATAGHLSMATGQITWLDVSGHMGSTVYLPNGYLVWSTGDGTSGTRLMAARFDLDTLTVGPGLPVVEQVQSQGGGVGFFNTAATGTLVYMTNFGPLLSAEMVLVGRDGSVKVLSEERVFHYPRLSPDGKWIAVSVHLTDSSSHDLYLYPTGRETGTRLTTGVNGHLPLWTPSGDRITFARFGADDREFDIYWKRLDEDGNGEPLLELPGSQVPRSWSADGRHLLYETRDLGASTDLWVLPLGGEPTPFLTSTSNEHSGVFSPDGRLIAYVSDITDGEQIYVRPFPGPGRVTRVSVDGGVEPAWSRNGRELVFRSRDGIRMLSSDIQFSPEGEFVQISDPVNLFSGSFTSYQLDGPSYSVSADGEQFLMLQATDRGDAGTHVNLVLNWTVELDRLLPPLDR